MKVFKKKMKKIIALLLALVMSISVHSFSVLADESETDEAAVINTDVAEKRDINFNEGWKFYLGTSSTAQNTSFDDSSWESVNIPHDFSITQDFTTSGGTEAESGFLPGGTGWYRKHFTVDASEKGKNFVLSFDGAYENTYVYVNGNFVGENHYGYNSFAFDITEYLNYDGVTENIIAVKVVHEIPSSRWYSGSGIYRDVTLTVTDPIHVATNGIYIMTPSLEIQKNGDVTVEIQTELENDSSSDSEIKIQHTMLTAEGEAVSDVATVGATLEKAEVTTVTTSITVNKPELWDIDNPVMYELKTEIIVNDSIVDTYYTDFGFRYFEFDANNGFYLNGKAVKIKGVCMHHDQGALGSAAYDDAMYRQLALLKDMGCNAVRTSHNIADEDFIRLCNEMGMLVMEEAFDGWSATKNDNSHDFSEYFNTTISSSNGIIDGESGETWAEFTLKSMVKRDRNAPSVIMWDIGNEIMNTSGNTSQYVTYAGNMIEWIQSLDETRPITHGDNKGVVTTSSTHVTAQIDRLLANSGGVVGFNYWAENLPTVHSYYPSWKLISTETVSSLNTRGGYSLYVDNYGADTSSSGPYICNAYDNYCVSWGTTAHNGWYNVITNDCNAGEFIWTGFDYIGEPNPWWSSGSGAVTSLGAAPNSSSFGALDTAGFPKDKYYFYRSQWNDKDTTLHLVTAWDSDNQYLSNGKTPVWIYTNAYKVELYRKDSNGNAVKLATSIRNENTTSAGHSYGTYTSTVNNSTYCSEINTSGATTLSARFNVTYTDGSIYAIAYDENGNVISNTVGNACVNTPGDAAKLNISADKQEIDADGYSLSYITIDVTDADDNLDTAAMNELQFTLEGEGEIVGVDNGNPATTEKYQQSSVLTSPTSAKIDAYAGKALVIVRSTKNAGEFTLTAEASGLSAASVTVTTTAVTEEIVPEPEEPETIPVTEITLSETELELEVGENAKIVAAVMPENATDKTVTWEVSKTGIVSVENGEITAIAEGSVVVTAKSGDASAECSITVVEEPVEVKLEPTVSLKVEYVNSKIVITGQSDIGINPDEYCEEIKHGVLYVPTSQLGSKTLLATTARVKNQVIASYNEDGTFSYSFKPLTKSMSYSYRAYVYYTKEDGTRVYAYSPIIKGKATAFAN